MSWQPSTSSSSKISTSFNSDSETRPPSLICKSSPNMLKLIRFTFCSNLNNIIINNIKLLDKLDKKIQINFKTNKKSNIIFLCDLEQMNRVFFNLINTFS